MEYLEFLKTKIDIAQETGFAVDPFEINKALKPHQRDAVIWALKGGRRAVFASFGLGKTCVEIEFCHQVVKKFGGKALIVCPLGVKQEFSRDAKELLHYEPPVYVRNMEEIRSCDSEILITNYERVRDGDIDPTYFTATSLDEASVLRSFGSKTYQTFLDKFKGVPYKLVATATPSPNKYKELIHYSGYLEILDTGNAITRFFQRDSTKANNLTLYPTQEDKFWLWVSSWALFITKPSDLNPDYSDEGYVLPPLNVKWHELPINYGDAVDRDGQISLFTEAAIGLKEAAHVKRESIDRRVARMKEIVDANPDEHFILWHDLEDERHAIKKALPDTVDIYGSQDYEIREKRVIDFSEGRIRLFATKKELSGSGCNFQRFCHRAIFLGIDYEFNDFIQAIHRVYRFLQEYPVTIDIIYMENEREIKDALLEKWKNHEHMVKRMIEIVKKYGLSTANKEGSLERKLGVKNVRVEGNRYVAVNDDCIAETRRMESNSVGLIHTSIPFCYDDNTEILTRLGWKHFCDLNLEDQIAAYSEAGDCVEYQKPSNIIYEHYDGEMISFSGRGFNLCVTPNHRMYAAKRIVNKTDEWKIYSADEITKVYENAKRKSSDKERILRGFKFKTCPKSITHNGNKPDTIKIPKLPTSERKGHGVELYWIETEKFMKLAGWYLSEGHADSFVGKYGGRLSIGQSPKANLENYTEIASLFEEIGLPPSFGKNQITVWCRNLAYFMRREFGHGEDNKHIPRWVFDLDGSLLEILRDTMMKGDGGKDGRHYASISRQLRNDFQELCILTGWKATLAGEDNKHISISIKQQNQELRHIPKRYNYSGNIGCVTVPSGLVIIRRNGKVCISGNSNHYEYSSQYEDLGFNKGNKEFFEQMDFLTPELYRVLKPGRVAAIHVKDRVLFGNATGTGMPTIDPFHVYCIEHYMKHRFQYCGMITVVTDVVRENNQTYRLGWTEQCKDGSKMGVGCPEYILLFRKLPTDRSKAYADEPVTKSKEEYTRAQWQIDAHAYWRSSGDRLVSKEELKELSVESLQRVYREYSRNTVYDYKEHVELAKSLDEKGKLPAIFMVVAPGSWTDEVWDDINRMRTLNTTQSKRRAQLHLCCLQLDIVERIINRYSNEGDTVYDPFGGLMTVPMVAVKMKRKGIGCELNADYFRDGVGYLQAAEMEADTPTLFDFMDIKNENE